MKKFACSVLLMRETKRQVKVNHVLVFCLADDYPQAEALACREAEAAKQGLKARTVIARDLETLSEIFPRLNTHGLVDPSAPSAASTASASAGK